MLVSERGFYYAGIGSRETPPTVLELMSEISVKLSQNEWVLRSGGANGADSAFEKGCKDQAQIFLPWSGFNSKYPSQRDMYVLSEKLPTWEEAQKIAKKFHPNPSALKSGAMKLMARNIYQVLGPDLSSPSKMVICWTPQAKITGGTGQALRLAIDKSIPIYNLADSNTLSLLGNWVSDNKSELDKVLSFNF